MKKYWILLILLSILLSGCSIEGKSTSQESLISDTTQESQISDTTQESQISDTTQESQISDTMEEIDIDADATESSISQFIGAPINTVNEVIEEGKIRNGTCNMTPEVVFYGYYYNEETDELYTLIKYINPADSFRWAVGDPYELIIYTQEEQEISLGDYFSSIHLPPYGFSYKIYRTQEVTSSPARAVIDDREISLENLEITNHEAIQLPNSVTPNIDVSDAFRELADSDEELAELKSIESAVIEKIQYYESVIFMTLTITPNKYIDSYLFGGENGSLYFSLITDQNEGVSCWNIAGVNAFSKSQLPANEPFTLTISFNPLTMNAESFVFHVAYYWYDGSDMLYEKQTANSISFR